MTEHRQRREGPWFDHTVKVVAHARQVCRDRGTLDAVLALLGEQSRRIASLTKSREPDRYGLRRDDRLPPHLRTATSVMEAVGGNVPALAQRYYAAIGIAPGPPIEGSIKGVIHGETYDLTSFNYDPKSPRPIDRVWVHTHSRHVGPVLDHCRDLFQVATEQDQGFEAAFQASAAFLWWFYHAYPFVQGSEAAGFWLLHYALGTHGTTLLQFAENPAALAWVCPNPDTYVSELRSVLRAAPAPTRAVVATVPERMLCYAARRGDAKSVKKLLGSVPPNKTEGTGYTALQLAAREGHDKAVRILLSAGADPSVAHPDSRKQALHMAARGGHIGPVKSLRRAHAHIDAEDATGSTPLHWAVRSGHAKVVKALLKAGANANAEDKTLRMPLHYACQHGDVAVVRMLLSHAKPKLSLNSLDEHQESPLALAATAGHTELVKLLLKGGAQAPAQDTTLTALSVGDLKATGLMKQERMNPGLYRLLLRVAGQGHDETVELLRQVLLKSLRRSAREEAAAVLTDLPRRSAAAKGKSTDAGNGLTYAIRSPSEAPSSAK